jgi:hypothetical protein
MRQSVLVSGRFEPFAQARFIPACLSCGAPNDADLSNCAKCDAPVRRCQTVDADVKLGLTVWFGDLLMRVGNFLRGAAGGLR